jgi:hypothetical protein
MSEKRIKNRLCRNSMPVVLKVYPRYRDAINEKAFPVSACADMPSCATTGRGNCDSYYLFLFSHLHTQSFVLLPSLSQKRGIFRIYLPAL